MSDDRGEAPLTAEQQSLIRSAEGLVKERVAWHVARTGFAWLAGDMTGAANEAVNRCARRFSAKWQTLFTTYARHRIDGAILDLLVAEARQHGYRRAAQAAVRWGVALAEVSGDEGLDARRDDEAAADAKLRAALKKKGVSAMLALAHEVEELSARQIDPERAAAMRPAAEAVRRHRESLPPRDQRLLACVYEQGLTLDEAAAELGLAYPTTKVLHAKLLRRLREAMAERGVASPFSSE